MFRNDSTRPRIVLVALLVVTASLPLAVGPTDAVPTRTSTGERVTVDGEARHLRVDDPQSTAPIRQARLVVFEADGSGGTKLAETRTDDEGRFSVTVTEADGFDAGDDLFVRVYADNPAVTVESDEGVAFSVESTVTRDVASGASVTLQVEAGADWAQPSAREFELFGLAEQFLDHYRFVERETGWTRSSIPVVFDGSAGENSYTRGTSLDRESIQVDTLDERMTAHEYGHAVMGAVYRSAETNPFRGVACHTPTTETSKRTAYAEGFAEFFSRQATDGAPATSWDNGGTTVETNEWYNATESVCGPNEDAVVGEMDGENVEGSVHSVLFDMVDSGNANDESMEYEFGDVFAHVRAEHPRDFTAFLATWDHPDEELRETARRYGIRGDRTIEVSVDDATTGETATTQVGEYVSVGAYYEEAYGGAYYVDGATVSIDGEEYSTNDAGGLTHVFEQPGTYTVVVSKTNPYWEYGEATVTVVVEADSSVEPLCPGCGAPTDLDGDGRYEDVDGDGRLDYYDVAVLYQNFGDDAVTENVAAFDFDRNGRLEFGDVVTLYESVA